MNDGTLPGTEFANGSVLTGTDPNNVLDGGGKDDRIRGLGGADILWDNAASIGCMLAMAMIKYWRTPPTLGTDGVSEALIDGARRKISLRMSGETFDLLG